MEKLNSKLTNTHLQMPYSNKTSYNNYPEKVLQYGEGNFLRGFADWMFNELNKKDLFNGKVVIVQPIKNGLVDVMNEQNGMYTLLLRGIQDGRIVEGKEIITSISRGINPYDNYTDYMKCAENPDLRVIISNTTEAGISYSPDDRLDDVPPASFPGKLAAFLYKRYKTFNGDPSKGFIIIPCELIDRNGDKLKETVLHLVHDWKLEAGFINWVKNANHFLNSLVDRIVTGYPKDEISSLTSQLGYEDKLLDTAEVFHLWVIEGDSKLSEELPFTKAGLNVIWTDNMAPYRTRKVRILNGAHTMTVLAAYLYGKDTIKECMDDSIIRAYMEKGIYEEIIPTLDLPYNELKQFADAVLERFQNPFIKHYLLSISLNSTSKFKTRVLPSITEYVNRKGTLPEVLTFSMAALIAFYKGVEIKEGSLTGTRTEKAYKINDDTWILEIFKSLWKQFDKSFEGTRILVSAVLGNSNIWGSDLNKIQGFTEAVTGYLYNILSKGIEDTIKQIVIL